MSLQTTIDNLKTRRDNIATELAAIAVGVKGYYPTASGPGANPDHDGHTLRLWEELARYNALINQLETDLAGDGGNLGDTYTQGW